LRSHIPIHVLTLSAFRDPTTIICCTLLGIISQFRLSRDPLRLTLVFAKGTDGLAKVNTLAIEGCWLAVGGFGKDKRGIVELWSIDID
jgi:hypothetical protein